MKIACISTSAVPSTTANSIQMLKVSHALNQINGSVEVIVPGSASSDWNELASHYGLTEPFPVHWLPSRRIFRRYDFALQALALAKKQHAELVYTWVPQAALLAVKFGIPAILEVHDQFRGRLGPWLFRRFIDAPGKKRLLVITRALLTRLENRFPGLPSLDVQIAPNGVDPDQYRELPEPAAARERLDLPQKVTALYSGHFYSGRGVEMLLRLAKLFPEVSFVLIGGRPADILLLEQRLSTEGITNITLTGFVPNQRLAHYQAAADILLMPYEYAIAGSSGGNSVDICSPMKMFDYLASGRAILASDLPVFHEVLSERNCLFCQPQDLTSWRSAFSALIKDPSLRARLGEQARLDSVRYSWRARAEKALKGFA